MSMDDDLEKMLRPPINRAMTVLDRSFFQKKLPTSVARVYDKQQIPKCRTQLGGDLWKIDRMQVIKTIQSDESEEVKALLLQPSIKSRGEIIALLILSRDQVVLIYSGAGRFLYLEFKSDRTREFFSSRCNAI